MKRQYDEHGFPILTKEEWKAGMTPYDVQDANRFIGLFKLTIFVIVVILAFVYMV